MYGGRPCLAGTRFPILRVAAEYNGGITPEEIASDYDLPLDRVFAGLAYYMANKEQVDTELEENLRAYREAAAASWDAPPRTLS